MCAVTLRTSIYIWSAATAAATRGIYFSGNPSDLYLLRPIYTFSSVPAPPPSGTWLRSPAAPGAEPCQSRWPRAGAPQRRNIRQKRRFPSPNFQPQCPGQIHTFQWHMIHTFNGIRIYLLQVYRGVRRYKLVLKDKTRPCITQNGSPGPPEHPGTHTRAQNDLAGPGSGARYAVVGHPEVGFWPFRSKVPLNLN
jgi:hypothetical protein